MASGKKLGTVLVLVVLLGGLAAAAGFGSYFLMSADDEGTHTNDAMADAADEDGADGDGAEADGGADEPLTDEEILAELEDLSDGDDTGAPKDGVRAKMRTRGKMRGKGKGKSTKAKTRVVEKKSAMKKVSNEDCSKVSGVYKTASSEYTLTQSFVDKYIKDMSTGQKQGSAGWSTDNNGKRRGVRVKRLRCAPRLAGLKNKDTITEIAGHKVTTTAAALLAYKDVKKADSFTVKLVRKGTPMTLKFAVGEPPAVPPQAEGDAAEGAATEGEGGAEAGAEGSAAGGDAAEGTNEEGAE